MQALSNSLLPVQRAPAVRELRTWRLPRSKQGREPDSDGGRQADFSRGIENKKKPRKETGCEGLRKALER
jgi:hypothetical protein